MLRKLTYLILCIAIVVCDGCVKEYTTKDVIKYIKDNYDITDFKVLDDGVEQKGDYDYIDTLWTVYDQTNDITFHVLDNVTYSYETAHNYLMDDYEAQALKKYEIEDKLLTFEYLYEKEMLTARINAEYSDTDDFNELYESLLKQKNHLEKHNINAENIIFELKYSTPIKKDYIKEIQGGNCIGYLYSLDENIIKDWTSTYLRFAMDYNLKDILQEFSSDEIKQFIKDDEEVVHVGIEKDGEVEWYDDLTALQSYAGISFGTLYEILLREGFDITGTYEEYSFEGIDHSLYEISYNYSIDNYHYYLKDGEKVLMPYAASIHFAVSEIEKMTGLKIINTINTQEYE